MALIATALLAPAIAGMWLILAGRTLRDRTASALAMIAATLALGATIGVVATGATWRRPWIPSLGVDFAFASDWISAPLLLLAAGVTLLVVVHAGWHAPPGPRGLYLGLILLIELGALASFLARDLILFFISFEIVLVPMWLLVGRFGDSHDVDARADAAGRFVLYTVLGSSVMLAGILTLIGFGGTSAMDRIGAVGLTPHQQLIVAVLLTAGLAVKVPLVPVHTWLPPAHTIAPTGGSVLLAAILLKLGTYGLIRLPQQLTPDGFHRIGPVLAGLGVLGILWGGFVCLVEPDLKRLIAFSSVAHMGFVALALGSGMPLGTQAALLTSVAHGVIAALLFVVVGGLKERWGSSDLAVLRPALRETWPRFGAALLLGLAATLGLPGLAGFPGEFLTLVAAWSAHSLTFRALTVAAAIGAALASAYALRVARQVWAGDGVTDPPSRDLDLSAAELIVCGVLGAAILVLGVAPSLVIPGVSP